MGTKWSKPSTHSPLLEVITAFYKIFECICGNLCSFSQKSICKVWCYWCWMRRAGNRHSSSSQRCLLGFLYATHHVMFLWTLLCALGHSDTGRVNRLPQMDITNLEALKKSKFSLYAVVLTLPLKNWNIEIQPPTIIPPPPNCWYYALRKVYIKPRFVHLTAR